MVPGLADMFEEAMVGMMVNMMVNTTYHLCMQSFQSLDFVMKK